MQFAFRKRRLCILIRTGLISEELMGEKKKGKREEERV